MTRLGLGLVAALALCACPGGGGSGGGGGTGGSGGGGTSGGGAGGGGGGGTGGGATGGGTGGGSGSTNPLPANYNGEGSVVLVTGTGSVVVAGLVSVPSSGTFIDMMAAKFDGNLARDTSFGTNGVATVDWDGDNTGVINLDNDFAYGAAFDGDKLVLVGAVKGVDLGGRDAALARLTATGALDTTFGTGGKTQLAHDPTFDTAFRNVVVAGGKYVACGSYGGQFFAMRFNSDGTPDNTFTDGTSAQGVILTATGSCTSMVAQGANLLIGGETTKVARLSASGAQDMTFGTANGEYADDSNLGGIFIRTDGKLWLVGIRTDGSNVTFLHQVLLSADGVPDTSFGTNGVQEQQIDLPTALLGAAMQGDKLVLYAGAHGTTSPNSVLMRVNADGTLDSTFGTAGFYTLPFKGTQGHSLVGSRNHLTVANNVAYIGYVQPLDVDPFTQFVIFKYALP